MSSPYSSADEEYDSDEPPELQLNIPRLMERATAALKAECTHAERLTRGSNHEIFVLKFHADPGASQSLQRADFSCIARFTRVRGNMAKDASEIATAKYIKRHTGIPVPEVYYQDLDPDNEVGAPFVFMERMPGRHLHKIWDHLSLESKKAALTQIASIVAQLASLNFGLIGCLNEEGVGPVISPGLAQLKGPFNSTEQFLRAFVSTESVESPKLRDLYLQIQDELDRFFAVHGQAPYLQPPYNMIHADFDGQNLLFTDGPDGPGPTLTGLIDFEYAYSGPRYFLYEHPVFIQDVSWSKELYAENAALRAHFVRAIYDGLPNPEERATFIACMNAKTYTLSSFWNSFMLMRSSEGTRIGLATSYLQSLRDGTGLAYSGRIDYVPELYAEDGSPLPPP